jgi:hypothetical protein
MTISRARALLSGWLTPTLVASLALVGCAAEPNEESSSAATPTQSSPGSSSSDPSARPSVDPGEAEEALPPIAEPLGEVLSVSDPRGDVRQQGADDETPMKLAPHRRDGDVVNVRLVHATDRIYIHLDLIELNETRREGTSGYKGSTGVYYVFLLLNRADGGNPRTHGWSLRTGAGHRSGETKLWQGDIGPRIPCEGLVGQFDYERDEVRISIPRTCLDDPEWVQASLRFETYRYSPRYTYAEDYWPELGPPPGYEEAFSPRVFAP